MALSQRLEFRQSQALVMTPQLMQAIKLLQLSSLDLAAYVEGELERNPLLERAEADDNGPQGAEPEAPMVERNEDASPTADWMGEDLEVNRASMEQGLGTELENVFPDDGGAKTAPTETPPPAYSEWSGVGTGAIQRRAIALAVELGRDRLGRTLDHTRLAFDSALQQGVLFEFPLDVSGQIQVRELQQLDGLHQLRRHHQGLALTEF